MMLHRAVEAERAADGFPRGLAFGVVKKNDDDPDGLGRVRVKLDLHNSEQTTFWARVVAPMSGNQTGFYTLPDVGDEVLVGFIAEDPSHPVVLGGVWNGQRKPPETNPKDGENDVRVWRSREGHEFKFVDTKDANKHEVTVSVKDGPFIQMTPKHVLIKDAAGNLIEMTKQGATTLKAKKSIKLEAPQVEVDAKTAKLSGSAKCEVKGGMVEIN